MRLSNKIFHDAGARIIAGLRDKWLGSPSAELLLQALCSLKQALTPARIRCTLCPASTRVLCSKTNCSHRLLRCKYSLFLALKRESPESSRAFLLEVWHCRKESQPGCCSSSEREEMAPLALS